MNGWVGWYRRDFTLPSGAFNRHVPSADRRWIIEFESVNYSATVWLNGHRLGAHEIGHIPFQFVLSHLKPGVNRLIVRVNNQRTGADFPPGPGGGWWNFGGILDVVYLRPVQRADLDSVLIRPELSCARCAATIYEQATVRNLTSRRQRVKLAGRYGDHAERSIGAVAGRLLLRERDPQDPADLLGAAEAQRPPAQPARGEHPRADGQHRGRPERPPAPAADHLGPRARRRHHPGSLPARSRAGGDGRPSRDPAVVRGARLPEQGHRVAQPGLAQAGPGAAQGQHRDKPEPPLDPALEHRQRAARAAQPGPDHLRQGGGRRSAQARPHPTGGHGDPQLAQHALPERLQAASGDRRQRVLRLV